MKYIFVGILQVDIGGEAKKYLTDKNTKGKDTQVM